MARPNRDRNADKAESNEIVVKVKRCAKVMKGGKRFSFAALVVVGDRKGNVGFGHGKAKEVPFAVEKAIKDARKNMVNVKTKGTTIPHTIKAKSCASIVMLRPACPGTGIIAGAPVRAVMELVGVKDILTKVFGSTNPTNVVKAVFEGLRMIRSKQMVESDRGVAAV
ncbi:MAG: small subunit ribosomal protein [Planctomycetota bacterium]|nr:MAG: small subunit ribosomal protein [Planctomycetota bacterium]